MKDLKLATLALTTTVLIASNLIISKQYMDDSKRYETKIHNQYKLIKQYDVDSKKEKQQLSNNQAQISNLNVQLDQLKQENDQLKKQLEIRKEMNSKRKLTIEVSAYTSNCRGCSGKTFIGYNVNNTIEYNGYRVLAADPRVIPLYSIVKIDTENESIMAVVIDTGGAIKGNKADLLVKSYNDAIQFGRKKAVITVIKEGNNG
jgi:3D (Asp-Asp-Asp) domain-containing protein